MWIIGLPFQCGVHFDMHKNGSFVEMSHPKLYPALEKAASWQRPEPALAVFVGTHVGSTVSGRATKILACQANIARARVRSR
jgi:hypothetical protein